VRPTLGLLKVSEVAKLLHVSAPTVYRLVASDELKSLRVSGAVRIAPRDVNGYLAETYSGARGNAPGIEDLI